VKAIFSGVTRIYIRELVEYVVIPVELFVPDAIGGIAVVNQVPDVFVLAQRREIVYDPDERNHDQYQPGTHVDDVIHIGGISQTAYKIITCECEYG
jgi:hypothetical protein